MDLVASCKEKLAYFRIKELKDVLTQLGLSKQGKKQDLVDRILSILSDEQVSKLWPKKNAVGKDQVAELVDDTYRKMQISGATTDLASKGQCISDSSNVKVKGEIDDPFHSDIKVRCLCGSSLETESMIKCEDPRCHVWQHMGCVIIPDKPLEGNPPVPELFYCELCRLSRADPFWVTVLHPLHPVKLNVTSIPTDGSNPVQSVDKTFQLTRADKDLLSKQEYDIQAWCMLLNDKVCFRMQWPQYADLQVNGMPVRAINRPGSQLLGANGRDDGPIITPYTREGINKICLTGCDARIFCLGVRIVKRRTVQQILNLIPKESEGERFDDALARVCRCVGGGTAMDNADSDSDLEVVADSFTVNLRCPMSGSRMKVAGRFKPCLHMGCFDLDVFVELNQRSRKWQCPICLKNYALENVIIDPYFNRIASMMRHCGEDVAEIEVKPDGSWRAKVKSESERRDLGELGRWHLPDSTLCIPTNGETIPKSEVLRPVKLEGVSEGHTGLKLGIRKNRNGIWEVSRPEDMNTSSGNKLHQHFGEHELKVVPMSSSATGSGRDGEDASVNQEGGGNFDFSMNNGIEMDSFSLNIDSAYGFPGPNSSAPVGDAEVIVLSDSDEDIMPSETIYMNNFSDAGGIGFPVPSSGIVDSYGEDPVLATGGNPCLGLFNGNDDEFNWPPLPSGTQAGPGFQLFSSEADLPDALAGLHHESVHRSTCMNGYTLAPETAMGTATLAHDSSVGPLDADMNDGLVDNPLAFAGDDPSLQIFLPTRPSDASVQSDLRDRADVSNGVHSEDWISLRLGGDASGIKGESATPNGQISKRHVPSREATMNTLAEGNLSFGRASISVFYQTHISILRVEMMQQQQQQQQLGFEEPSSSISSRASLLIRHLPEAIPEETLFRLLSHYGASSVRSCSATGRLRNCAFVDFQNEGLAYQAQRQLNGLKFLGKVLKVERATTNTDKPLQDGKKDSISKPTTNTSSSVYNPTIKRETQEAEVSRSEPIAPRLGVDYCFPPHLEYAYPPPDGNILTNIVNALIAVPRFYTQVLHLMNKMNIPAPFRMALPSPPLPPAVPVPFPPPPPPLAAKPPLADLSSEESEMESSDEEVNEKASRGASRGRKRVKRESILGPAVDKGVAHEDIGLKQAILVPKEMPMIKKKNPLLQITIAQKVVNNEHKDDSTTKDAELPETESSVINPFATPEELERGKLPPEEILSLPMFKNYTAGTPTSVLYIKNLAKDIVADDFYYIFGSLFGSVDAAKSGLSVKLMQEGRMRGQAFVTFPSVEQSQYGLNLVNGYVFKGKPMIIQFGRNPAAAKAT